MDGQADGPRRPQQQQLQAAPEDSERGYHDLLCAVRRTRPGQLLRRPVTVTLNHTAQKARQGSNPRVPVPARESR